MNIVLGDPNLVTKWMFLKSKGAFITDEIFITHLLSHEELCQNRNDSSEVTFDGLSKVKLEWNGVETDYTVEAEYKPSSEDTVNAEDSFQSKKDCRTQNPCLSKIKTPVVKVSTVSAPSKETKKKEVPCMYCEKVFGTRRVRKTHLMKDHEKEYVNLICSVCEKKFSSRHGLMWHVSKMHTEQHYKCPHCEKTFGIRCMLNIHVKTHKEEPVSCVVCNKQIKTKTLYKLHLAKMHSAEKIVYQCTSCIKRYKSKGAYEEHLRTHLEGEPICDVCGASYSSRTALQLHRLTHNSGQHQCLQCARVYPHEKLLYWHVRRCHEKPKKNYLCNQCGQEFATADYFRTHQRKHTGERPYICDVCGFKFRCKKTWKDHAVVHTGERPFKCKLCDSAFGHKSALYLHDRLVHKKIPRIRNKKKIITNATPDVEIQIKTQYVSSQPSPDELFYHSTLPT